MSRIVVRSKPRSRKRARAVSRIWRRVSSLSARCGTARLASPLNMFKEYDRRPGIVKECFERVQNESALTLCFWGFAQRNGFRENPPPWQRRGFAQQIGEKAP